MVAWRMQSSLLVLLDADLEELDALTVKHRQVLVSQEDDSPHECSEPQCRVLVGLVLADHNRVRNR